MFFSKIWERYFLEELVKTTLFFLVTFYGLYILVDYANHSANFHKHHVQFQWKEVSLYYVCELINRISILLPFALLLATIRVLCAMNSHNELVALMSGGISVRTLMRPFVFIGFVCVGLIYINTELLLPKALLELKLIHDSHSSKKDKSGPSVFAQHLILEDNSTLVYQNYDAAKNMFFDAYWIRSINEIYRIKYLYPQPETSNGAPMGHFVDYLIRNDQGQIIIAESTQIMSFPIMRFNQKTLFDTMTPPEERSISDLWMELPKRKIISEKEADLLSTFYQKLIMPWFCLLAIIGPAPFCLRITRNLPIFFIYAGSIFGLVALYLIIDAAVVLAERQVIEPIWAIWPPFLLVCSIISFRYLAAIGDFKR